MRIFQRYGTDEKDCEIPDNFYSSKVSNLNYYRKFLLRESFVGFQCDLNYNKRIWINICYSFHNDEYLTGSGGNFKCFMIKKFKMQWTNFIISEELK